MFVMRAPANDMRENQRILAAKPTFTLRTVNRAGSSGVAGKLPWEGQHIFENPPFHQEGLREMNKLLAALVATLFAGATFAASHAGAPMAAASGAKPAASAEKKDSMKADAKTEKKAETKAEKKADKMEKKAEKAEAKAEKAEAKASAAKADASKAKAEAKAEKKADAASAKK